MPFTFLFSDTGIIKESYWQQPIPLQGKLQSDLPDILTNLSPANCGACHSIQYQYWRKSFHAKATGDGLLGQLYAFDTDTQLDCLKCHSPRQEQINQLLNLSGARSSSHGIDCASCHVRKHIRHSSRDIPSTPHGAVKGLPIFKKSEFCKSCHQFDDTGEVVNGKPLENTFVEWQASLQAKQGKQCQSCHMPDKKHLFRGIHDPDMTRTGLGVKLQRTEKKLILKLGNTGAGHALPTYITPRINVLITGSKGKSLRYTIQRKMAWDEVSGWSEISDTRLFPKQWETLSLKLGQDETAKIVVKVEPDYDYHKRIYPKLLNVLSDDLKPDQKSQLKNALKNSGKSAYILYSFDCNKWKAEETDLCHSTLPKQ